jgi:hypothetical protein
LFDDQKGGDWAVTSAVPATDPTKLELAGSWRRGGSRTTRTRFLDDADVVAGEVTRSRRPRLVCVAEDQNVYRLSDRSVF